jgi:hypothetical protein
VQTDNKYLILSMKRGGLVNYQKENIQALSTIRHGGGLQT